MPEERHCVMVQRSLFKFPHRETSHTMERCRAAKTIIALAFTVYLLCLMWCITRLAQLVWATSTIGDQVQWGRLQGQHESHPFTGSGDPAVTCATKRHPGLNRKHVNASAISSFDFVFNSQETVRKMVEKNHGLYLPLLDLKTKIDFIHLFTILDRSLDQHDVQFFVAGSSLLGIVRHGGFVPWESRLVVAVNTRHQPSLALALSCIDQTTLSARGDTHWTFSFSDSQFPSIDVVFFQHDDLFLWSLTQDLSKSFIYKTKEVFPLSKANFEGVLAPVPGRSMALSRRVLNHHRCLSHRPVSEVRRIVSRSIRHNRNVGGLQKDDVDCRELAYIYPMQLV